jgi:hypothetical protein
VSNVNAEKVLESEWTMTVDIDQMSDLEKELHEAERVR